MTFGQTDDGDLANRYIYGPQGNLLFDQEITPANGEHEQLHFPITDHQNSVRAVVDEQMAIEQAIEYSPFGRITEVLDENGNPLTTTSGEPDLDALDAAFAHHGSPIDEITGLLLKGRRWYDADAGRFLSEDPIAADVNTYRFAGNDPVNFADPSGLVQQGHPLAQFGGYRGGGLFQSPILSGNVNTIVNQAIATPSWGQTTASIDFSRQFDDSFFNLGPSRNSGSQAVPTFVSTASPNSAVTSNSSSLGSLLNFAVKTPVNESRFDNFGLSLTGPGRLPQQPLRVNAEAVISRNEPGYFGRFFSSLGGTLSNTLNEFNPRTLYNEGVEIFTADYSSDFEKAKRLYNDPGQYLAERYDIVSTATVETATQLATTPEGHGQLAGIAIETLLTKKVAGLTRFAPARTGSSVSNSVEGAAFVSAPRTTGAGTFYRNGGALSDLPPADAERMLSIARRQAARLGIDPSEVHGITNLGGSATGATMGGRIHLDPRAFRQGFDSRLGRTVSPIENLKRNLIHEHAHVLQSTKRADLYWSGTPASRQALEDVAYRFEDFWYGTIQRQATGR